MDRLREELKARRKNYWRLAVATAAVSILCQDGYSADVKWVGDEEDGLWSSANNWDGGVLPGTTSAFR